MNMKKLWTLVLTASMVGTMSFSAFALPVNGTGTKVDDNVEVDGDVDLSGGFNGGSTGMTGGSTVINKSTENQADIPVKGRYTESYEKTTVVSVDVKWDSMKFIYAESSAGDWDPLTHAVTGKSDAAGWVKNSAKITCVNHSNSAVCATLDFESENDAVTGTFDKTVLSLATAVGTKPEEAPTETATFTIGGTINEDQELGTITVALSDTQYVTSIDVLKNALENGGNVTLCGTTSLGDTDNLLKGTTVLNLNGKTFSLNEICLQEGSSLTITGEGTVTGTYNMHPYFDLGDGGTLIIEGGTYTGCAGVAMGKAEESGTLIIRGGDFTGNEYHGTPVGSYVTGCEEMFDIRIEGGTFCEGYAGSNFRWQYYVDTDNYEIKDNGDSTYTVVAK